MTDAARLRANASDLLQVPVDAAGVFACDVGMTTLVAGTVVGSVVPEALGVGSPLLDGVGAVAGRHLAHDSRARSQGLTGIMLVAVTGTDIVLMDWNGNAGWGTGPTRVLASFDRTSTVISTGRRGANRLVTLHGVEREAKISGALGWLSSGKAGKRDVLRAIGAL